MLLGGGLAERVPDLTQRTEECILADDRLGPDPVEKLLLGDHPIPVLEQVEEQAQGRGLKLHREAILAKLLEGLVHLEGPERKDGRLFRHAAFSRQP
jgi:hypothetical protein